MLFGAPDAIGAVWKSVWLAVVAAVGLALLVAACEPDPPITPTVPSLTPAAVSTTAASAGVPTQTATLVEASPAEAAKTVRTPAGSVDAGPSSEVPREVVERTEEKVQELTARMLRLRPVDTDVLWGALLAHRALGVQSGRAPDIDGPPRMLEMWHAGNPCYEILDVEVEGLGANNHLGPVDFNAYFDHILMQLTPCLDEQWQEVDGQRFFANSDTVKAERISTWFDSVWDRSDGEALTDLGDCREGFYAHVPTAVSAKDTGELQSAWGDAMVEFSDCRQQALRAEYPFVYLGESQLFAFELNDRYTLVSLQATLGGHLVAISMRRPYDECWPQYEADIPGIAVAEGPAQMVESRDAALRALRSCIEELPEYNPFGEG